MVVFTCNHCGDSLQKPKVEKHYTFACRRPKSLTCVDCMKDFREDEYVVHTKCITEDERYAAKGTYANGIVKKGEVKQESWVEMIKSILDKETNMKPSCRHLLNSISNYNNIPRKKIKFMNFIKSCMGYRTNVKDIEDVWNIIESYKTAQSKSNEESKNGKTSETTSQESGNSFSEDKNLKNEDNNTKRKKTDGEENTEEEPVPKKKNKIVDESITSLNEEEVELEIKKFRFQDVILEVLETRGNISLKKLQKKVINKYLKETGETEITPKIIKKFNRKLNKLTQLEINEGMVVKKD